MATSVLVVAGIATPIAVAQEGGRTDAVINEFSASTTSTDVEYLEVLGAPGVDYSNLTILQVEGDYGDGPGKVSSSHAVGVTDASGYWLVELAPNTLQNGTMSLLLVDGWDETTVVDTDGDGLFDDPPPFTALVDAVAVNDGGEGDHTYGGTTLGVAYDGFAYAPGGASRIPNGTDTDTTSDWVRNDFDLAGIDGVLTGTPVPGEACNTPQAPNRLPTATDTPGEYTCGDKDETPPSIEVSVTPESINPNNHKYVLVEPTIVVSDDTDLDVTVTLEVATSDEPDDDLGDGVTINDVLVNGNADLWNTTTRQLVDPVAWDAGSKLQVRAERMGGGDGRVYTFTWRATDDDGNYDEATETVSIPKG